MGTIAVFDSGLGSLSVIRAVQRRCRAHITYLADQESYPYGLKSRAELDRIIRGTIRALRERFSPDVIVVASYTPGLMLDIRDRDVMTVRPPLAEAASISTAGRVGILGTRSAIKSRGLSRYVAASRIPGSCRLFRIDGSNLVDLVESGAFLDPGRCAGPVSELRDAISRNRIDTVILSSTHLPFLMPALSRALPSVRFVDPAERVADRICRAAGPSKSSSLRICATGDARRMQRLLAKLGVRRRVTPFAAYTRAQSRRHTAASTRIRPGRARRRPPL